MGREAETKAHLKARYGITIEQYNAMLVEQDGKCGICEKQMEKPHVDHCHTTGKVRGLLCSLCNKGLGLFKDDTGYLAAAIDYLDRSVLE